MAAIGLVNPVCAELLCRAIIACKVLQGQAECDWLFDRTALPIEQPRAQRLHILSAAVRYSLPGLPSSTCFTQAEITPGA